MNTIVGKRRRTVYEATFHSHGEKNAYQIYDIMNDKSASFHYIGICFIENIGGVSDRR